MSYIYLAQPYYHTSALIKQLRYEVARDWLAETYKSDGLADVYYAPIVHHHDMAVACGLPEDWDFWKRLDLTMLRSAKALAFIEIPGWEESRGLSAEIAFATDAYIPVFPITTYDLELHASESLERLLSAHNAL